MNKILIIDGNSLTYRGYYATANSPQGILTTSTGIPTNAILSMSNMISKIIMDESPTHVFIAFDAGKKTKRHDLFPEYKGGRSKTPEELIIQFPLIKEMIEKMNIKWYELKDWEADDIIATIATIASKASYEIKILSSDKDLLQLVDENTEVLFNSKGVNLLKRYNNNNFFELTGHFPNQVPDIKSIMGDSSDNLEGVKGIGIKGANKLILEYGSLDKVYKNIEKIKISMQKKLNDSKDIAILCKELATLNRNIELPFSLEETKYKFIVNQELLAFFKKYELDSLVKRFEKYLVKNSSIKISNNDQKNDPKNDSKNYKKTKYKNIIF
ncbi:MAG: hypothetical protein GY679_02975 [Mycoplasma sp.]|nr:hypothetical protein [Mycoplasma sp.]